MQYKAEICFATFWRDVENALPKRSQKLKDYCAWVETLARLYRKRSTWEKGTKWSDWLERARDGFKDNWRDVSHLKQDNVRKIATGGTAPHLAIAIHYCMHASDEFRDRAIARFLDKIAFGTMIGKSSGPVFVYKSDPALPTSYPKISLPSTYQYGRNEFEQVKFAVLRHSRESSGHSSRAVIFGSGGYGKTSLATELCLDEDVRSAFPGGVYWLQFGLANSETENREPQAYNAKEAIGRMLRDAQYPPESHQLIDLTNDLAAMKSLIAAFPTEPLLIIADDLWTQSQAHAFSELPGHVSLLATTRVRGLKSRFGTEIEIKPLTDDVPYELMVSGLEELMGTPFTDKERKRLSAVSDRFHGWPLLLQLANATFRLTISDGATIDQAIGEFEDFASLDSVTDWDVPELGDTEKEMRRKFVGNCIDVGLKALPDDSYRDALFAMGVFPENTDVPFSVVTDYWCTLIEERDINNIPRNGKLISKTKAKVIRRKLNDLSFFRTYLADAETLRIHDVFLAFFRGEEKPKPLQEQHDHLVNSIQAHCPSRSDTLPASHQYGWRHLLYHLDAQGKQNDIDNFRTDYAWLKAKLRAVGALELRRSFVPPPARVDAEKVGRAIALSMSVILREPEALALQLYGRLGHENHERLVELVKCLENDRSFYPVPQRPHLPPIGHERNRMVGHRGWVNSAAFSKNGARLLTSSTDTTAVLWDSATGEQIQAFEGHKSWVFDAAFSSDETHVLTASLDKTAIMWSAMTGELTRIFEGHGEGVATAVFSLDGRQVLTGSYDRTARVWCTASEKQKQVFAGHELAVNSAVFFSDEALVLTSSSDKTASIWDTLTGKRIKTFVGHKRGVNSAVFSKDGTRVLTASEDGTACLWDVSSLEPIRWFKGHEEGVNSAVFSSDETQVLTASEDKSACLWDASTGKPIRAFLAHTMRVNDAIFSEDKTRVLTSSNDHTARLWDLDRDEKLPEFETLKARVNDQAIAHENFPTLSEMREKAAQLLESAKAEPLSPFKGKLAHIEMVSYSADVPHVLTASDMYKRVQIWDQNTGRLLASVYFDSQIRSGGLSKGEFSVTDSAGNDHRFWY